MKMFQIYYGSFMATYSDRRKHKKMFKKSFDDLSIPYHKYNIIINSFNNDNFILRKYYSDRYLIGRK